MLTVLLSRKKNKYWACIFYILYTVLIFFFLLFSLNNSLNRQWFRNDLSALSLICAFLSFQKQQWIFFPSPKLTHLTSCPFSTAIPQQSKCQLILLPRDFSHNILDEGCCPVSLYVPFIIALVYSVFWEITASKYQICIHLLLFLYKPWPNRLYTRNALEITVYFYFRLSKRLREKSTTWLNVFDF